MRYWLVRLIGSLSAGACGALSSLSILPYFWTAVYYYGTAPVVWPRGEHDGAGFAGRVFRSKKVGRFTT